MAVLEQVNHPAFKAAWREVLRRGTTGLQPDTRQLLQVWQSALAVKLEGDYSSEELHWDAGMASEGICWIGGFTLSFFSTCTMFFFIL
jgi:hypothetical protein